MVWNFQGSSSKVKLAALKDIIRTHKPSVFALIETHMGGTHAEKIQKIVGYDSHTRVDAVGFRGGIWVYWRSDVVQVTPITHHEQYVTLEISRVNNIPWFFTTVYASPDPRNKRELWAELEYSRRNCKIGMRKFLAISSNRNVKSSHVSTDAKKKLSVSRDRATIVLEARLRKELDEILEREELYWYQKSRVNFIRDGDRNTSYFHVSTLVRRWRNRINSLKNSDRNWVENKSDLKNLVIDFYKYLYFQEGAYVVNADIPYDRFPELAPDDFNWLTRPYTAVEIE
ncbi:uncharacterized protein LOC141628195 [Silene latifolia]|uniref:uncharacterized protein LOC141628195 n=1 Tax=Silene latifolia TaxID=37657 RepID=UPI003D78B151